MMYGSLQPLLAACRKAGVTLTLRGDRIGAAPPESVTTRLQTSIRARRDALVAYLGDPCLGRTAEDPRPDLREDSLAWTLLLERAHRVSCDLCGLLNGIRCMGARLVPSSTGGLRIDPAEAGDAYATWRGMVLDTGSGERLRALLSALPAEGPDCRLVNGRTEGVHVVTRAGASWRCDCSAAQHGARCSHVRLVHESETAGRDREEGQPAITGPGCYVLPARDGQRVTMACVR